MSDVRNMEMELDLVQLQTFYERFVEECRERDIPLPLGFQEAVVYTRALISPAEPDTWLITPYEEASPDVRTVFHLSRIIMEQVRGDNV